MTSCLLCLESFIDSEATIEIIKNINQNFTVRDAIVEYFKCSKAILESQLRFICRSCYNNLEYFHKFAIKVNNLYNSYSNCDNLLSCSSDTRPDITDNIDVSNESFIDDLIEYDEGETIEFENNDELSENIDKINSLEQIKDFSNEIIQSVSDDVRDLSRINIPSNLTSSQPLKTLQCSPVRVILPKNFVKISQSNFKLLNLEKLQSFKDVQKQQDNLNIMSSNEGGSQDLTSISNNKLKNPQNIQKCLDSEAISPKNDSKYAKNPSTNTKAATKSLQKSQILSKNLKINTQKIHKCEICIKIFKTFAILKSHVQKIHSDTQNPSICKECGKVYTNKYILKTHMRKHIIESDRSYECYICKNPSKNLPNLLDHFKYKHDPAYSTSSVCHICSKIVTRLDIHLRQMHPSDPIERVKCEICGHFMKKSSLKGHLASHNEAGFNCEACGKYLKNRNSLLCHMKRVHTTGKYKCEHCDKAFHQEGRLMDHIACQHTGVFLHKCRIANCDKKFRNAGRRRMHERRMHPVDYEKNLKASYLRENLEIQ